MEQSSRAQRFKESEERNALWSGYIQEVPLEVFSDVLTPLFQGLPSYIIQQDLSQLRMRLSQLAIPASVEPAAFARQEAPRVLQIIQQERADSKKTMSDLLKRRR